MPRYPAMSLSFLELLGIIFLSQILMVAAIGPAGVIRPNDLMSIARLGLNLTIMGSMYVVATRTDSLFRIVGHVSKHIEDIIESLRASSSLKSLENDDNMVDEQLTIDGGDITEFQQIAAAPPPPPPPPPQVTNTSGIRFKPCPLVPIAITSNSYLHSISAQNPDQILVELFGSREDFENLFQIPQPSSRRDSGFVEDSNASSCTSKTISKSITVIDSQKLRKIDLLLYQTRTPVSDIVSAIRNVSETPELTVEILSELIKSIPTSQELINLREVYAKNPLAIPSVPEQFLLEFGNVPYGLTRLQSLFFLIGYDEVLSDIQQEFQLLREIFDSVDQHFDVLTRLLTFAVHVVRAMNENHMLWQDEGMKALSIGDLLKLRHVTANRVVGTTGVTGRISLFDILIKKANAPKDDWSKLATLLGKAMDIRDISLASRVRTLNQGLENCRDLLRLIDDETNVIMSISLRVEEKQKQVKGIGRQQVEIMDAYVSVLDRLNQDQSTKPEFFFRELLEISKALSLS